MLHGLPAAIRYHVAFSGGADSHALLHALAAMGAPCEGILAAVHVNHGLQPAAAYWAQHCERVCQALNLPCTTLTVDVETSPGGGPEAAARRARYAALKTLLEPGDMLLTAHHQDDQAETVLLQLFRGSGPRGLAGMPACTRFGHGWLARPFLGITRAQVRDYCDLEGLQYITDPSNADTRLDRNFVRQEVLPSIGRRWPAISRTLTRVASHQADLAGIAGALGERDLGEARGPTRDSLSTAALKRLARPRQKILLRTWIRQLGLPTPSAVQADRILTEVVLAGTDRNPVARWPGAEVRRYRDLIYAMVPLTAVGSTAVWRWRRGEPCVLPHGRVEAISALGAGLRASAWGSTVVEVRLRRGGERCRPPGSHHTRSLKKLFQERGIPPWQRNRMPLIYIDGVLAAVGELWVCEPFCAASAEPAWLLKWYDHADGPWAAA